jgi:HlyD family secretion protein
MSDTAMTHIFTSSSVDRFPTSPQGRISNMPRPRTCGAIVLGLATNVLFFGTFCAWSILAPLSEAAIAPGVIKVEGQRRTIQHLEGGIVREMLVRDGSNVKTGQILMRLQDVQSESTVETQRAQRWALLAQDARLSAEMARAREITFPPDLLASRDPRALDAMVGQRTLFDARAANLNSQMQVLQARIHQQQAIIASARAQLIAAHQQLDLTRQEEQIRYELWRKGLGRLPELLAVQRTRAALEGSIQDFNGQIERADAGVVEAQRQTQQLQDQQMQDVMTDLRDVRSKLAETEERLRAANDITNRREIVAPEPGTIVNLRVFTVGAVVKAGDPIMDLVPEHDRLVAEVNVQPNDIDVIRPGLQTEVQLPAFKQRLVPYLHGHVIFVAADVATDEKTRANYYRVQVLIDKEQLEKLDNIRLVPGMPVEAHIRTGERSFFRYITQPILDSFHRAFQEK